MTAIDYSLRAGDLMTIEPVSVAVDALIEEAQRLILEFGVSGLPVVDEHREILGVSSQTDFMHL
jgi:CBS domain-containing protein